MRYGHGAIALQLAASEAVDLEAVDREARTALTWAHLTGYEDIVEALHRRDVLAGEAEAELLRAAERGDVQQVNEIINTGDVNCEVRDESGNTSLLLAARKSHFQVVEALLAAGAQPDACNRRRRTPLMEAASVGDEKSATALIDYAAHLDARDIRRQTPLLEAAAADHLGVVSLLVDRGAAVNIAARGGETPLIEAARGDMTAS